MVSVPCLVSVFCEMHSMNIADATNRGVPTSRNHALPFLGRPRPTSLGFSWHGLGVHFGQSHASCTSFKCLEMAEWVDRGRYSATRPLCRAMKKLPGAVDQRSFPWGTPKTTPTFNLTLDNDSDDSHSIVQLNGQGKVGLLQMVVGSFKDLGLTILKTNIDYENGLLCEKFWVVDSKG
eukprot:c1090_g2_i1 orf=97-630(+)